jgi:hypothetical protein
MLIGMFGGFYIVPLYAMIQQRSDEAYGRGHRGEQYPERAVHGGVRRSCHCAAVRGRVDSRLFLVTGILNAAIALFIYKLVPEFLMRFLAWLLIHTVYRVRKEGLENVPEEGGCIIVANHVSYVDAIVIAACVRRPIRFIMDYRIFRVPVLNWLFRTMQAIPVASSREDPALKEPRSRGGEALRGRGGRHLSQGSLTADGGWPGRPRSNGWCRKRRCPSYR